MTLTGKEGNSLKNHYCHCMSIPVCLVLDRWDFQTSRVLATAAKEKFKQHSYVSRLVFWEKQAPHHRRCLYLAKVSRFSLHLVLSPRSSNIDMQAWNMQQQNKITQKNRWHQNDTQYRNCPSTKFIMAFQEFSKNQFD